MRPAAPWAILPIDVEAMPETLALPGAARGAVLYFRLRGLVLGAAHEVPAAFPLSRGEITMIAAATCGGTAGLLCDTELAPSRPGDLATLWARPPAPEAGTLHRLADMIDARRARATDLSASIVICTRHRPDDLAGCLSSLGAEIAAGREVVVVDNGPDDETARVVRDTPGVRYVPEPQAGLSRARNAGLAAARGDIVVFVDDDVRPEPGWLAPLVSAFTPGVDVVCGLALPETLETEAQIAFQYDLGFGGMGHIPLLFDRAFVDGAAASPPVWDIGAGANMAVRRDTAIRLGGFDERVGPGAAGGCGDDSEFWHRVLHAGGAIVYEPLSTVRHRHRSDWPALERQAIGYGLGHIVALFAQYGRAKDRRDLQRALFVMPKWIFGRALRAPLRALAGRPDPLAMPWLRGYLSSLRHVGLAFRAPVSSARLSGSGRDDV